MAGSGRGLPKWQPTANPVPIDFGMIFAISKQCAKPTKKDFGFFLIFFSCVDDTIMYNQRKERLSEKND